MSSFIFAIIFALLIPLWASKVKDKMVVFWLIVDSVFMTYHLINAFFTVTNFHWPWA